MTDIDECLSDPCLNADCENVKGSYACHCFHKFFKTNQTDPIASCGELLYTLLLRSLFL